MAAKSVKQYSEKEFLDKLKSKFMSMKMTKKSNAEIAHVIAVNLIEFYNFKTIELVDGKPQVFIYQDGIYSDNGKQVIREKAESILTSFAKTALINEIVNKVARLTYVEEDFIIDKNIDLVCLKNGILNLKTGELMDFNPDTVLLSKLPLKYDKDAKCDNFIKFLKQTIPGENIKVIQEWFGFMLRKVYHEKKAIIFLGPKDTGKTVLMNVMTNFLGQNNVSSVDLHDISSDIHALEGLYNKYANINDELTSSDISDVSRFKKLTGRSVLSVNPKFKGRFNFENFAKLTFATNKMPMIREEIEDKESYYSRWIVLCFNNVVKEENKDKQLTEKLTTMQELSGILNWAIEGLQRLLENNGFSYDRTWQDVEEIMKQNGESVYSFTSKCVKPGDEFIENTVIYQKYKDYCILNGIDRIENEVWFGRKFKPVFGSRYNGNNKNGWEGIKIDDLI